MLQVKRIGEQLTAVTDHVMRESSPAVDVQRADASRSAAQTDIQLALLRAEVDKLLELHSPRSPLLELRSSLAAETPSSAASTVIGKVSVLFTACGSLISLPVAGRDHVVEL